MDDPPPEQPASTPPTPGERRLAHPPSDRYRSADPVAAPSRSGTPARGAVYGVLAAVGGAIAIVVLGGVLAMSAGLLVLAPIVGWSVAWSLKVGAGGSLAPGRLVLLALLFAIGAVVLGQVGLWLYARTEGGVLPLVDYLGQAYGILVPLQFVFAAPVAWVTAR